MTRQIGVLGGTFDPVHLGHLVMAMEALLALKLDEVVFVPAGQPWQKLDRVVAAAEERAEMVRLALEGNRRLRLSRVDVQRPGPSYAVDTLPALRGEYQEEIEFWFLVGLDALESLETWKEPERLLRQTRIVALPRPEVPSPVGAIQAKWPWARLVELEGPRIGISSSQIRGRLARGLPITYLVPAAVEAYIMDRGLYERPAGVLPARPH